VSGVPRARRSAAPKDAGVTLRLQGFAWEAVERESARMGISAEELVAFSVQYYLADVDSGRIARRIAGSLYADADADASP